MKLQETDILISLIIVLSVIKLYKNNVLLTLILILLSVIALKSSNKYEKTLYVIAAIGGPLGEILAIHSGAWAYANPTIFGIPVWLPFGWGLVVRMFSRITQVLID